MSSAWFLDLAHGRVDQELEVVVILLSCSSSSLLSGLSCCRGCLAILFCIFVPELFLSFFQREVLRVMVCGDPMVLHGMPSSRGADHSLNHVLY